MTQPNDLDDLDPALAEARQKFLDWFFRRTDYGWAATYGEIELSAPTLADLCALMRSVVPWRIWRSDTGRWWATRCQPFSPAAENAGAYRTVDVDDLPAFSRAIAEQESLASLPSSP